MRQPASTWDHFHRRLQQFVPGGAHRSAQRVWQLLTSHAWAQHELQRRHPASGAGVECVYRLTRHITRCTSAAIAGCDQHEFQRLLAQELRAAHVQVSEFRAVLVAQDADRLQRCVHALPPRQCVVVTLHLKGLSLHETSLRLRLSTFATYVLWRGGTLRLHQNLFAP